MVTEKLGADPAVQTLVESPEEVGDRTKNRVKLSLEEAVETDPEFAKALAEAVVRLQELGGTPGGGQVGTINIHAEHNSIAAQNIHGGATLNAPPQDPR